MFDLDLPTPDATEAAARAVAGILVPGDVVVLAGEMGAGKTTFAQGVGRALGITEHLTSPTYTLVQSYRVPDAAGGYMLHHADLYRLDRYDELEDLDLEDHRLDGVLLIEWGDVDDARWGDHLEIRLAHIPGHPEARKARWRGTGPRWQRRVDELEASLGGVAC